MKFTVLDHTFIVRLGMSTRQSTRWYTTDAWYNTNFSCRRSYLDSVTGSVRVLWEEAKNQTS
jgi:hypothetical protein